MTESKDKDVPTLVVRLTTKDEFNPVLKDMGDRLEALKVRLEEIKAELQGIAQLFIDNLQHLMDIKGFENGDPPISANL